MPKSTNLRDSRDVIAEFGARRLWGNHLPEIILAAGQVICSKCRVVVVCHGPCEGVKKLIDDSLWGCLMYHAEMN